VAVRGLLFDFDGLLVDTETPSMASWQELYREHGHELPLEQWVTLVGTIGAPFDPYGHLEELAGPLDRETVLERRRTYELSLTDIEELRPGVLDYLEEADRLGLKKAIVSSSTNDWIHRHLARLERAEHFDLVVAADHDTARAKPAPTLYLEALERLELAPAEAIAFEDSPNGIKAATAAGIFCVAIPNSVTVTLDFDEADLVLDSLAELPLPELLKRVAATA
jgi:putative hydrolase of the HAD superfamily